MCVYHAQKSLNAVQLKLWSAFAVFIRSAPTICWEADSEQMLAHSSVTLAVNFTETAHAAFRIPVS